VYGHQALISTLMLSCHIYAAAFSPDTMDQQSSLSSPPSPPDNAEHASPTITATNSKNLPSTPAHYGGDRSRLLSPGAMSFYLGECSSSDHEVEDEHVDDELSPCPAIVMSLPYTLTAPGRKKRRCRRWRPSHHSLECASLPLWVSEAASVAIALALLP
jgi:hypothetical protein